MLKTKLKVILVILITIILVSGLSVYATYNYLAKDIGYTKSDGTQISVEEALNELYTNSINKLQGTVWNFDFSGAEVLFVAPCSGKYKIEAWGAQGESNSSTCYGGYGGYSTGEISIMQLTKLYINVGGSGNYATGGYNGGGNANNYSISGARSGGGATHISLRSGLLKDLSNNREDILIVAGGGAGAYEYNSYHWNGNSGGGYYGGYSYDNSTAGTQNSGYQFGQAGYTLGASANYSGAGGGYYGGLSFWGEIGAGGGSGYISNNLLSNKHMCGYKCLTSEDESTKTISTTNVSTAATSDYAKKGNGFVRITLIE